MVNVEFLEVVKVMVFAAPFLSANFHYVFCFIFKYFMHPATQMLNVEEVISLTSSEVDFSFLVWIFFLFDEKIVHVYLNKNMKISLKFNGLLFCILNNIMHRWH